MALQFNRSELEKIIFYLADKFDIYVVEKAAHYGFVTGGMTLLGHLVGGKYGAVVGGALGYFLADATEDCKLTFDQCWRTLEEKVLPLLRSIYNRLRALEIYDYIDVAIRLAMSPSLEKELVNIIFKFFSEELGKQVIINGLI